MMDDVEYLDVLLCPKWLIIMNKNQVLKDTYQPSNNLFESDLILQEYLACELSARGYAYMHEHLVKLGKAAATLMDEYSLNADKKSIKQLLDCA